MLADFGIEGVNQSGDLMLEVCIQNKSTVFNYFIKKRVIHKRTLVWRVNGEAVASRLMNNFCFTSRIRARVLDVTVSTSSRNIQSDYHLVLSKLRVKYGKSSFSQRRCEDCSSV